MDRSLILLVVVAATAIGCGASFTDGGSSTTSTTGGTGAGATTGGSGGAGTGGSGGTTSSSSTTSTSSSTSITGIDAGPLGPTVEILHPGTDPRPQNVSIYFHGAGTDPTDGTLSGAALVWRDDLEGQFGTGEPVNWAPTQVGTHTVTLTGTDSLGFSANDTVTFDITQ